MSQMDDAIQKHFELCAEELPKKFVPWSWVVGICLLLLASIGGTTWAISAQLQDVKSNLRYQDKRIEQLEKMADDINWIARKLGKE